MYFITKTNELIGKEVAYVMANQFCSHITIVTKDKGVFIVSQDEHETEVFNEHYAKRTLHGDKFVKSDLEKLGLITKEDWSEYEETLKQEAEKRRILMEKQKEEKERKEFERLSKKFNS